MKQILLLVILASALFAIPFALAQEDTSNTTEDTPMLISANTVTDANTEIEAEAEADLEEDVSSWQIGRKTVGLWFTFNQEKIAEKQLELAKLRLVQARVAAKNNNTEAMEQALEAHERIMEKVQARMQIIASKNLSSDKLVGLNRAIQVHEARISRLSNLLESANLTEEQRTRVEARIQQQTEVTENLNEVQSRIQERVQEMTQKVEELKEEAESENKTVQQVWEEQREERQAENRGTA